MKHTKLQSIVAALVVAFTLAFNAIGNPLPRVEEMAQRETKSEFKSALQGLAARLKTGTGEIYTDKLQEMVAGLKKAADKAPQAVDRAGFAADAAALEEALLSIGGGTLSASLSVTASVGTEGQTPLFEKGKVQHWYSFSEPEGGVNGELIVLGDIALQHLVDGCQFDLTRFQALQKEAQKAGKKNEENDHRIAALMVANKLSLYQAAKRLHDGESVSAIDMSNLKLRLPGSVRHWLASGKPQLAAILNDVVVKAGGTSVAGMPAATIQVAANITTQPTPSSPQLFPPQATAPSAPTPRPSASKTSTAGWKSAGTIRAGNVTP